jgi:ribosome-binding protein aMBF1 (putative translation factor)
VWCGVVSYIYLFYLIVIIALHCTTFSPSSHPLYTFIYSVLHSHLSYPSHLISLLLGAIQGVDESSMFVSSEVVPLTRSRASVKIVDLYSSKKTVNSLSDNNSIYFYQVRRHHPSCGTAHVTAPTPIASIAHSALSTSTSAAHINDLSQSQNQSQSHSKDRSSSDNEQLTSHVTHSNVEVEANGDAEHAVAAEREREGFSRLHLTAAVVTEQPGLDRNSSDEHIEEKLPESSVEVEVEVEPTVRPL